MPTLDGASHVPTVFVSYSHDSAKHLRRVLALCDRLRGDGIAAELDQYEPVPPAGWPLWAARKVEQSDFVLVVCTESYRRRFDGQEEAGKGLGVRSEAGAIAQTLYEAESKNSKILPVLFTPKDEAHIPLLLRGTTHFLASSPQGYEQLYRYLTHQPEVPRPDLGTLRPLPPRPRTTEFPVLSGQSTRKSRWKWFAGATLFLVALGTVLALNHSSENNLKARAETSVARHYDVLRGEILDAQSRAPLSGVLVRLPEFALGQTTSETGQYRFELEAAQTPRIKVRATKTGYRALNLDLPSGEHLNVHQMRRDP